MSNDLKRQIVDALASFSGNDLKASSITLLNALGYVSEKQVDLDGSPDAFFNEFNRRDRELHKDKALFDRWESIDFLFQISDSEIQNVGTQETLGFDSGYDPRDYQSYLFFALDLKRGHYTRTQLSTITREINLLFEMPVMLIMRHNGMLTLSVIDRRISKRDESKDVLEKVKLIKDIRYAEEPHRAHIEILYDLSLLVLIERHGCRNFHQLHEAWRTTLDSNELNKKFYRELANWYFWALEHVEFPSDIEKNADTRNATNVIRLLTRLLFCWFLKEKKLISDNLFSRDKLSSVLKSLKDNDSTFYLAILQNLFFGTLNQRMNTGGRENRKFSSDGSFHERKDEYGIKNLYRYQKLFAVSEEEAVGLFSDIPFLNGGLFDCLDKEDDVGKVLYVDGFTRNPKKRPKVPNFLFFSDYKSVDLSDAYGDKERKKEKVRGLIHLLGNYKFTITENTPIEEEIALDPELLGKVFENLLASYNPETKTTARKQTGSFYTPREIVNYMVDESLIAYLKRKLAATGVKDAKRKKIEKKFRHLFAYTKQKHQFSEVEVNTLIEAIDTCKILDPACGSGAFPMGILHKLVFILGKLDPHNECWKQKQLDKLDSISMREELERTFRNNDDDYGRKLYLIENCIYGVDIQPIAIQISKLRFFISLICDQRTNNNKAKNCGVRSLPNLETKFVAANTLVSLDYGQNQTLFDDERLKKLERQRAEIRHKYFAVQHRPVKLRLQKKDAELRTQIEIVLNENEDGLNSDASHQLAAWKPYDQNVSVSWFDPEYMFGVREGFDIVIGNPPYLESRSNSFSSKMKNCYRDQLNRDWKEDANIITKGSDLLIYFFLAAAKIIKQSGQGCFLTSNAWLYTDYGKKFQNFVIKNFSFIEIIDSDFKYFYEKSSPNINTVISGFCKEKGRNLHMFKLGGDFDSLKKIEEKNFKHYFLRQTQHKWGFLYEAPEWFVNNLVEMKEKSFPSTIEVGQGLNIDSQGWVPKTSKVGNCEMIPFMAKHNCFEVKSVDHMVYKSRIGSRSEKIPALILPRGIGRHFCAINSCQALSNSYVEVYLDETTSDDDFLYCLWLYLNSSLVWLFRELAGRKNLGGGMLKAEAIDLTDLPMNFPFNFGKKAKKVFESIRGRAPLPTEQEVQTPEHQRIDEIILAYFGFAEYQECIVQELINRIKFRKRKSASERR